MTNAEYQTKNAQVQQAVQKAVIWAIVQQMLAAVLSVIPGFVWPAWSPKRVDETTEADLDSLPFEGTGSLKEWCSATAANYPQDL